MSKDKNQAGKGDNTGCIIILVIVAIVVAIAMWTSRDADKLGPSDDPYYDAPRGFEDGRP